MSLRPPRPTRTDTLFPYTTLFRSLAGMHDQDFAGSKTKPAAGLAPERCVHQARRQHFAQAGQAGRGALRVGIAGGQRDERAMQALELVLDLGAQAVDVAGIERAAIGRASCRERVWQ